MESTGKEFADMSTPKAGARLAHGADELKALAFDLTQLCLDIAGIFDPTPISDGVSALISLGRGDWLGGLISGASMVPYIGDLAKAGKFPKYLKTLEKAIQLAQESAEAAKLLKPIIQKLDRALDLLPDHAPGAVQDMRRLVKRYLHEMNVKPMRTHHLPDIRGRFNFKPRYREGGFEYVEASGRLGVPGKVLGVRDLKAQKSVAGGTGDHAGHLIGTRFGGPGDARNLTPQNAYINSYAHKAEQHWSGSGGSFLKLEDQWEEKLHRGIGIEVRVRDKFHVGEDRPFARLVEWTEHLPNGKTQSHHMEFLNAHTPLSREKRGIVPEKHQGQVLPFKRPGH